MSGGLRARLRLVFGAEPAGSNEDTGATDLPAALPWIELVAFTEDCRVSGRIQLDSDRLSDTLNSRHDYLLCDVACSRASWMVAPSTPTRCRSPATSCRRSGLRPAW